MSGIPKKCNCCGRARGKLPKGVRLGFTANNLYLCSECARKINDYELPMPAMFRHGRGGGEWLD